MAVSDTISADNQKLGNNSILSLQAELISESKVKATLELYEGNDRPNIAFLLSDSNGELLARSFIISCIDLQTDFTLHIRQPNFAFPLILACETFFEEDQTVDRKEVSIKQ